MIYANTPDEKAQEHTDDQSGSSSDYRSHRARLRSSHRCHPASLGGRLRGYSASLGGRLGGHLASLGGRLYCLGCLQVVHILSELLHVCSHISFHFVLSEFLHVCTYSALSPAVEFSHRLIRSCSGQYPCHHPTRASGMPTKVSVSNVLTDLDHLKSIC